MKSLTAARNRKNAQKLFLREKSLKSKNPSLVSVGAIISSNDSGLKEYARQLREKQKVRRLYGINENQFHKYYVKASSSKQNSAERMLQILECRLDNVIYRAGFASSRAQARQFASHGWFSVNGQRVNIPSILLTANDVIKPSRKPEFFKDAAFDMTPKWLSFNKKDYSVKIESLPERTDSDPDINEQLIVEYYSR